MFIKKANEPELQELVDMYITELSEAGIKKCNTEKFRKNIEKELLFNKNIDAYVVIEGGRVASVCYCNMINLLPMPDKNTNYYFISDVFTLNRYRNTNFENLLLKYVKCEMERANIKEYSFNAS